MFFYRIGAFGYEESYTTTYISEKQYSQEEFEDLVLSSYEKLCYQILDVNDDGKCFWSVNFAIEYSIFSNAFHKILEEDYGLINLTKMLSGRMIFDLTHSTDEEGVHNKDNMGVYDVLSNLDVDLSCYDKCDKRESIREDCLVSIMRSGESIDEI